MNNRTRMVVRGYPTDEETYHSYKMLEQKQWYWNDLIRDYVRTAYEKFPISLVHFREDNKHVEGELNPFLLWIFKSLALFFDSIEDVFILDERAKEYLKDIGYSLKTTTQETQNNVNTILQSEE